MANSNLAPVEKEVTGKNPSLDQPGSFLLVSLKTHGNGQSIRVIMLIQILFTSSICEDIFRKFFKNILLNAFSQC